MHMLKAPQCRWMGSARYTVGALKESFAERSYLSSMAFLTAASAENLQPRPDAPGEHQKVSTMSCQPSGTLKCLPLTVCTLTMLAPSGNTLHC